MTKTDLPSLISNEAGVETVSNQCGVRRNASWADLLTLPIEHNVAYVCENAGGSRLRQFKLRQGTMAFEEFTV